MSADNWTTCPQCSRRWTSQLKEQQEKVRELYGKVGHTVYISELENLHAMEYEPPERDDTFREDYEIGVFDDELFISYKGQCRNCGFSVTFKHTKSVFD